MSTYISVERARRLGEPRTESKIRAVELLNQVLQADPETVNTVLRVRAVATPELEAHPTIVCRDGEVGFVGLLNGLLCQADDRIRIARKEDDVLGVIDFHLVDMGAPNA